MNYFKYIRVLVAVALLCCLLYYIGLEQIELLLKSTNPYYLIVFYGLLLVDSVFRSFNWNFILRTRKHFLSLWEMIYNYVVGGFFGTFIPSTIGTDFSRAFLVARRNKIDMQESALALVVLNLLGLLAVCIVGFLGSLLLFCLKGKPTIIAIILPFSLAYLGLFVFLLSGWKSDVKGLKPSWRKRFLVKINEFTYALQAFRCQSNALSIVLGMACLNQLMRILMVYTVALALDVSVPFLFFVVYVPIINLCRIIPFSVAGLGAEQGVFVILFTQAGVPAAEAFMISLVLSVSMISFWLLGGGFYLLEKVYHLIREKKIVREIYTEL